MNNKTVLLVGGGSGGHLVPVFEVYKELKKNDSLNVLVVGSGSNIEKKFFEDNPDYRVIRTGKLGRKISVGNTRLFFRVFLGILDALKLLRKERPSVIFSKGGYVSFPVIFWAKLMRIPYFIHESDVEMGLSNKYASNKAKMVFVGYPLDFYKKGRNLVYSGQIIRSRKHISKSNYKEFGFNRIKPVILITGGSQGSLNMNKVVTQAVPRLLESYNIIHQTGELDFERVVRYRMTLDQQLSENYYVSAFLPRHGKDWFFAALSLAEVVVARAGATTVAEIASMGKPMILIPYKYAAGDHQNKNACFIMKNGGALVVNDDSFDADNLISNIEKAINKKEELTSKAGVIFPDNGIKTVISAILDELERKK